MGPNKPFLGNPDIQTTFGNQGLNRGYPEAQISFEEYWKEADFSLMTRLFQDTAVSWVSWDIFTDSFCTSSATI